MKTPSPQVLKKQSQKVSRKKFKKLTIEYIKGLSTAIKHAAKNGKFKYSNTFPCEKNNAWSIYVACRWYRRHSRLKVEIEEEVFRLGKIPRFINSMYVSINWE